MSLFLLKNKSGYFTQNKNNLVMDTSRLSDYQHDQRSNKKRSLLNVSEETLGHHFRYGEMGREGVDEQTKDAAFNEGKQFGREVFSRLYEDCDYLETGSKGWAKSAMDICDQLPEFLGLQAQVKDDPDLSAIATAGLLKDLAGQISNLRDDERDHEADEENEGEWEISDSDIVEFRAKARKAVKDAIDDIKDTKGFMAGIGDEFNQGESGSGEDRTEMINELRNNKNLQEILKRAGRLYAMMSSLPSPTKEARTEIVDIEFGRDLSRLMNQPKAYLSSPETEDLFYSKFVDQSLDLKRLSGKEPLGRGNLILLVDESGSMDGARNDLARALTCAILIMASKEKRSVSIVGFNNGVTTIHSLKKGEKRGIREMPYPSRADDQKREMTKLKMLSELAGKKAGGGTSFDAPFNCGLNMNHDATRSDFIVITDGYASLSENTIQKVQKARDKGMRVWIMLMGCTATPAVEAVSDIVIDIEALQNTDDKDEAIASIMAKAKRR
jgi:uncharacterized protein with von Willebrand factor type A (vWA) domain